MRLIPRIHIVRAVAAFMCALSCGVSASDGHPRLMFRPHELPALRAKVLHEPWSLMFAQLKADLWKDSHARLPRDWNAPVSELTWAGRRAAFLYVLTGDDAYAAIAREVTRRTIDAPEWGQSSTKGLTLYNYAYGTALMYDWCYDAPSWDATFREEVSLKLRDMADLIVDHGGTEQNRSPASNWQGIRGAAAAWTYLAIDHPYDMARYEAAWNRVCTYLRENLGSSPDGRGWNIEGLGYTYYPMGDFIGAYGYAQWRIDPTRDLRAVTPAAPWNYWTVYATTLHMSGQNFAVHPDWGDDNAAATFSGTLGQAFWWMPEEFHPGLLYVYDRLAGPEADSRWDSSRAGTIWSILFHPGWDPVQVDPSLMPSWLDGYIETGGNGYVTWRSDTDGVEDIIAQTYAKLRGNMGHSGPDGLGFRIVGLDNAWAVGGGRYGPQINGQHAYYHSMNSLYPVEPGNTLSISGDSGSYLGEPVVLPDGSGHAVLSVARSNLNVRDWTRRFAVDYSGRSGAEAVFVISDTSTDGQWWQMVTHEDNTIETDGNRFTIHGANGHRMEGTVLHPANVNIITGTRIRGSTYNSFADAPSNNNDFLYFNGAEGDFLVVLSIVRDGETAPVVSATGTWNGPTPSGTVTFGGRSLAIDGDLLAWDGPVIVAGAAPVQVPEGGSAVVSIRLSEAPEQTVAITPYVLPGTSGEPVFTLDDAHAPIVFDALNWSVPQAVTVVAAPDADGTPNTGRIRFYADASSGLHPLDVDLLQIDSGPHEVAAWATEGGTVTGVPASRNTIHGSSLTLDAIAHPGFEFAGWSDGVSEPSRNLLVEAPVALEAIFVPGGYASQVSSADSFVRDGSYAASNYGASGELVVKSQPSAIGFSREAFLRFPLPETSGKITQAMVQLTLTGFADPGSRNRLHLLTDAPWDELSVIWNNRPAAGVVLGEWTPQIIGTTHTVDVTAAVLAALAARQSHIDFALTADGNTYAAYASREAADPDTRPTLQLRTDASPPAFTDWAAGRWPEAAASERAPHADANGDGLANLLEYFVGDRSGLPRAVSSPTGPVVQWQRRTAAHTINWHMLWAHHPAGPWHLLPAAATRSLGAENDRETLLTRLPESPADAPIFLRLHLSLP